MKTYFELKIGPVSRADKDDVSYFCFDQGCAGIAETLPFQQKTLTYEPEIFESQDAYFSVYFLSRPSEDFFILFTKKFPQAKIEVCEQEEKDWLKIWKENFKPFNFAKDYWIVPSWHEPPPGAIKYLLIDPGMAFGTGTHETTKLAAQWYLDEVLAKKTPTSVLDVGTGTGILAFVAHREGAKRVMGIDIDPECIRVAKENAVGNDIAGIEFSAQSIEKVKDPYDVVFANIVSGVLLVLSKDLARLTKPNGYLILAGVLKDEKASFREEFIDVGPWEEVGNRDLNDWTSFCLKRKKKIDA